MDVTNEKSVSEAIKYRRSIRVLNRNQLMNKSKRMYELASLAPTSSNMQLWEFYHIVTPALIQEIATASLIKMLPNCTTNGCSCSAKRFMATKSSIEY
jgi:nitroreductase